MKKKLIILIFIAILATAMYLISGYPQTKIITPSSSTLTDKYQCPKTEWIDCLPGPDKIKSECRPQYLKWAQENCSSFQGAAY